MRKWLVLIDAVILLTALAVLAIDWQIKQDILAQAKELLEAINGQGTTAAANSPSGLSADLLRSDDLDNSALESEASPEPRPRRTRSGKGSNSRSSGGSGGNVDPGIQTESE